MSDKDSTTSAKPVILPGTESHILHSEALDETFQIDVSLPAGYEENQSHYPVVYVLDGNLTFPILDSAVRLLTLPPNPQLRELILVGVGYREVQLRPWPGTAIFAKRWRDLLISRDHVYEESVRRGEMPGHPKGAVTGGAEVFFNVLDREVKPLIQDRYRIEPKDQTLVGFSFGGLFALYVLFEHTDAFDRYVIGSPSIWWHDRVVLKHEEAYASRHADLAKRVFFSVCDEEESGELAKYQMVTNFKVMAKRLQSRAYPSLRLITEMIADENHASGLAVTLVRGLRSVLGKEVEPECG